MNLRAARLAPALALALALALAPALAQSQSLPAPVATWPTYATTAGGNASGTIGTGGGTFQLVFAAGSTNQGQGPFPRRGCTIQNNGTHTMWISEGLGVATATEAKSFQLAAGAVYDCSVNGSVLIGEIDITGTASDPFYAAQW
jgi:hypothetical protein